MDQLPQNDHDLLVTIHGQVNRAISDIKELKDNVAERVNKLENDKATKEQFNELKQAIDGKADVWTENAMKWTIYIIVGAVIVGLLTLLGFKNFI